MVGSVGLSVGQIVAKMKRLTQYRKNLRFAAKGSAGSPDAAAFRCPRDLSPDEKATWLRLGHIVQLDTALMACGHLSAVKLREFINRNSSAVAQHLKRWINQ